MHSYWIEHGKVRTVEEPHVPTTAAAADSNGKGSVSIELDTPTAPARIDVRTYPALGADHLPVGRPTDTSCTTDHRSACRYETTDSTSIVFSNSTAAAVLFLNAAWTVPPWVRAGRSDLPSEVSASWVFLFAEKE